jgi:hypothetical protein
MFMRVNYCNYLVITLTHYISIIVNRKLRKALSFSAELEVVLL